MERPMKRKQFHMTIEDEKTLKDLAKSYGLSEAEIVRESLREYAEKRLKKKNPLLEMAEAAEKNAFDYHFEIMGVQLVQL